MIPDKSHDVCMLNLSRVSAWHEIASTLCFMVFFSLIHNKRWKMHVTEAWTVGRYIIAQ